MAKLDARLSPGEGRASVSQNLISDPGPGVTAVSPGAAQLTAIGEGLEQGSDAFGQVVRAVQENHDRELMHDFEKGLFQVQAEADVAAEKAARNNPSQIVNRGVEPFEKYKQKIQSQDIPQDLKERQIEFLELKSAQAQKRYTIEQGRRIPEKTSENVEEDIEDVLTAHRQGVPMSTLEDRIVGIEDYVANSFESGVFGEEEARIHLSMVRSARQQIGKERGLANLRTDFELAGNNGLNVTNEAFFKQMENSVKQNVKPILTGITDEDDDTFRQIDDEVRTLASEQIEKRYMNLAAGGLESVDDIESLTELANQNQGFHGMSVGELDKLEQKAMKRARVIEESNDLVAQGVRYSMRVPDSTRPSVSGNMKVLSDIDEGLAERGKSFTFRMNQIQRDYGVNTPDQIDEFNNRLNAGGPTRTTAIDALSQMDRRAPRAADRLAEEAGNKARLALTLLRFGGDTSLLDSRDIDKSVGIADEVFRGKAEDVAVSPLSTDYVPERLLEGMGTVMKQEFKDLFAMHVVRLSRGGQVDVGNEELLRAAATKAGEDLSDTYKPVPIASRAPSVSEFLSENVFTTDNLSVKNFASMLGPGPLAARALYEGYDQLTLTNLASAVGPQAPVVAGTRLLNHFVLNPPSEYVNARLVPGLEQESVGVFAQRLQEQVSKFNEESVVRTKFAFVSDELDGATLFPVMDGDGISSEIQGFVVRDRSSFDYDVVKEQGNIDQFDRLKQEMVGTTGQISQDEIRNMEGLRWDPSYGSKYLFDESVPEEVRSRIMQEALVLAAARLTDRREIITENKVSAEANSILLGEGWDGIFPPGEGQRGRSE